jgi:hypothetical protein
LFGSNLSFENLSAGDYFFSSFDTNNCLLPQQEVFFSIVEPSDLIVESFTVSDFNGFGTSCVSAQDGFINIEISGEPPHMIFYGRIILQIKIFQMLRQVSTLSLLLIKTVAQLI